MAARLDFHVHHLKLLVTAHTAIHRHCLLLDHRRRFRGDPTVPLQTTSELATRHLSSGAEEGNVAISTFLVGVR